VDALLGLAAAYEAQGRSADAERTFARAVERDPGYWRVHEYQGFFFLHAGRYADAARSYAAEIAVTPDNPRAHNNLGAARFAAGDFEKAAEAWRASLALAPTPSAFSNLGTSEYYLGRVAEAAAAYERAIALAPGDHRLRGNLGDALARAQGRGAEARAAYEEAIALGQERLRVNPADAGAIAGLARYHASLGRADVARRLRAEALERDPSSRDVHYSAAVVSARLGETDAALAALERAVALGYDANLLQRDPALERFRALPRFRALRAPTPR
jgi:tetratricopeptide (TPR) repeat protein